MQNLVITKKASNKSYFKVNSSRVYIKMKCGAENQTAHPCSQKREEKKRVFCDQ